MWKFTVKPKYLQWVSDRGRMQKEEEVEEMDVIAAIETLFHIHLLIPKSIRVLIKHVNIGWKTEWHSDEQAHLPCPRLELILDEEFEKWTIEVGWRSRVIDSTIARKVVAYGLAKLIMDDLDRRITSKERIYESLKADMRDALKHLEAIPEPILRV